jgi:peptidoglycan lytic transglycosylase G
VADQERTAAEREAARLERERRRAGQAGPPEFEGEDVRASRNLPDFEEAEDPIEEAEDPIDEPDRYDDEVPLGTRRVSRGQRRASPTATAPRRTHRRGRAAAHPRQRRPGRLRAWSGRIVALVALVIAAGAIWFLIELYQPFGTSPHGEVTVTIPAHDGARKIGDLLAAKGVVSSGFFFNLRASLSGDRGKLLSGTYHLRLGMSYSAALKALTTAPPAAKVSELTLIEGLTRSKIDHLLRSQHIRGNYLASTRHSPLLDPRRYGAPARVPSLEGFLFPDTYQLRDPITVGALVADQLKTFKQEFARVNLHYSASRHLSAYDVLIIASLVQAEAQRPGDQPLVASVIYNRLRLRMLLQIDATTRYATGNYSRPLTVSQLHSPSPWNTRVHAGLPPTPIDNPGLAAIRAAANPAKTSYIYYVTKACGNGALAFASTGSQFNHLVAQYYAQRARLHGRSPTHC